MTTAWDQLIANSTLSSGTAWQHLQNQEGGGAGTGVVINDGLHVELVEMEIQTQLDDSGVSVTLDDSPVEVVLDTEAIVVEIE
jgi:hypothetical protein